MNYYPIHIDIQNQACLVVGGGRIAERKVMKLNEAGAAITVISKDLTPALVQLVKQSNVTYLKRYYESNDVKGFFLVFAATNNSQVNRQVCAEAKQYGAMVNSLNGVEEGNFILPASCSLGDLNLGITTQGQSPALSAQLRRYFSAKITAITESQIEAVANARLEMLSSSVADKESKRQQMQVMIDEIIQTIENTQVNLNDL